MNREKRIIRLVGKCIHEKSLQRILRQAIIIIFTCVFTFSFCRIPYYNMIKSSFVNINTFVAIISAIGVVGMLIYHIHWAYMGSNREITLMKMYNVPQKYIALEITGYLPLLIYLSAALMTALSMIIYIKRNPAPFMPFIVLVFIIMLDKITYIEPKSYRYFIEEGDYKFFNKLTVIENITFPYDVLNMQDKVIKNMDISRLMQITNLYMKADKYPKDLNSFERKSLVLARDVALCKESVEIDNLWFDCTDEEKERISNIMAQIGSEYGIEINVNYDKYYI